MTDLETHAVPAAVDPTEWTLTVTGTVDRPLELTAAELASFPTETFTGDFECVEGWVAEDLAWRGVPVDAILEHAEPTAGSEHALVRAMDGEYACAFALDRLRDAVLAFELDGYALDTEHGGPARLVPVARDRDCWESVKWVSAIEVFEDEPTDTARDIALSRVE